MILKQVDSDDMEEKEISKASYEVVWTPFKGSQAMALDSRADHTLYHGTRGPGKTTTQIMRFLKNVGKGYGAFWKGVIFDMEFDNLGGLVADSKKWFTKMNDGARFMESPTHYKWVWPTGEELLFRHVKRLSDYEKFHGHEYPFIGWNELTKYSDGALYEKFMSVNRSSFDPIVNTPKDEYGNYLTPDGKPLPPLKMVVFSTTNPSGVGHAWVKRKFIDPAPSGTVVKTEIKIFNPKTEKEETYTRKQVAIFGSYKENKLLPSSYIAELESITDENQRRAWLEGDWDVTAGGALDDLWDSSVHVVDRFVIPDSWYIDRSFDNGTRHPFSVGWWAESDGTEAEIIDRFGNSRTFAPPAGSLIQLFEYYGSKDIGSNKGIGLSSKTIAQEIIKIEASLIGAGWINSRPKAGAADNKIRETNPDADNMEKIMANIGVRWLQSDKASGSRVVGLQLLRERLENAKFGEGPSIYFMRNCRASIQTLPVLPRDPKRLEDVDTSSEDHAYDMVRYRILQGGRKTASAFKVVLST